MSWGPASLGPATGSDACHAQFRQRHGGIECQAAGYAHRLECCRNHLVGRIDELGVCHPRAESASDDSSWTGHSSHDSIHAELLRRGIRQSGIHERCSGLPNGRTVDGYGVAPASHYVDLSWEPGDGNAVGYNVYRGTAQGGPYEQINIALESSTNYTDSTVVCGTTYYYVTTEVNAQGQESGYSNVAKAVIPSS